MVFHTASQAIPFVRDLLVTAKPRVRSSNGHTPSREYDMTPALSYSTRLPDPVPDLSIARRTTGRSSRKNGHRDGSMRSYSSPPVRGAARRTLPTERSLETAVQFLSDLIVVYETGTIAPETRIPRRDRSPWSARTTGRTARSHAHRARWPRFASISHEPRWRPSPRNRAVARDDRSVAGPDIRVRFTTAPVGRTTRHSAVTNA